MQPALAVAAGATVAAFLMMLGEALLSRVNERALRARGAVEPPDDVYRTMQWAYPGAFLAMGVEGALVGPAPGTWTLAGAALFGLAKVLKYWAIASLGPRWTFRVLVPPAAPVVTRGPYAWLRHPNYVAVVGELLAFALMVGARAVGPVALVGFAAILRRRIAVENRALGRQSVTER